ncbi:MAG TPA: hypothetical protein VFW90_01645, partial [Candidatus Saccharimonadales bacterium]|nr:hypothetical protein [Candidatus Saccharimonadales bacterium]
ILVAYILVTLIPLSANDRGFLTLGTKLLSIIVPTLVLHVWLSSLFGLEEVRPVVDKLKKVILKPIRIE